MLWILMIGIVGIYYFFWRCTSNHRKRKVKRKNYRKNLKYKLREGRDKED